MVKNEILYIELLNLKLQKNVLMNKQPSTIKYISLKKVVLF